MPPGTYTVLAFVDGDGQPPRSMRTITVEIGQEVVRLATAFRMDPVVVRRSALGDEPCPVRPLAELADAVSDADAVVVALPLAPETRGIVSAEVIAAMAPHAVFVNVPVVPGLTFTTSVNVAPTRSAAASPGRMRNARAKRSLRS